MVSYTYITASDCKRSNTRKHFVSPCNRVLVIGTGLLPVFETNASRARHRLLGVANHHASPEPAAAARPARWCIRIASSMSSLWMHSLARQASTSLFEHVISAYFSPTAASSRPRPVQSSPVIGDEGRLVSPTGRLSESSCKWLISSPRAPAGAREKAPIDADCAMRLSRRGN